MTPRFLFFRAPDLPKVVAEQLYQCERDLLHALAALEHAKALVDCLQSRQRRLKAQLTGESK